LDILAYVVGLALGDGNLSNPNGRATKLRITCDTKYPKLIKRIVTALKTILPTNKVSILERPKNCVDVYCHSNKLESLLGWKARGGSKYVQKVSVPDWIKNSPTYSKNCLRGLFETDGSVYRDRGYLMSMFVTIIPSLAQDVTEMICNLGFTAHTYHIQQALPQHDRYNIRISKNTAQFVQFIGIIKD